MVGCVITWDNVTVHPDGHALTVRSRSKGEAEGVLTRGPNVRATVILQQQQQQQLQQQQQQQQRLELTVQVIVSAVLRF